MKIGVLCVTFNRRALLEKLLANYASQEDSIDTVLVVDNLSTDGTAELLRGWEASAGPKTRRVVLSLSANTGGAGGFHAGLQWFQALGSECPDYVYLADDDAFPAANLFGRFREIEPTIPTDAVAACTAVVAQNGVDTCHRRDMDVDFLGRPRERQIPLSRYSAPFRLNTYSFVGVLLKRKVLEIGILPDREFFIGCDDSDHSLRTSRHGSIWCYPELEVRHDHILDANSSRGIVDWKSYYLHRNWLLLCRRNFGILAWTWETAKTFGEIAHLFKLRLLGHRETTHRIRVLLATIADSARGKTGLHPVYRPGWKV